MTSSEKHSRSARRRPTEYRRKVAAYLAEGRHLITPDRAKTIRQMADEIGVRPDTLRSELRRNYYALWAEWWPSFDALLEQVRAETAAVRLTPVDRGSPLDRLQFPTYESEDEFDEAQRYL
jgi:IS30 family transposase